MYFYILLFSELFIIICAEKITLKKNVRDIKTQHLHSSSASCSHLSTYKSAKIIQANNLKFNNNSHCRLLWNNFKFHENRIITRKYIYYYFLIYQKIVKAAEVSIIREYGVFFVYYLYTCFLFV